MKAFFLTLLVAIVTIASIQMARPASQPSTTEIVVRDIIKPQIPTQPRSALPIVCAEYSSDMSALDLSFTQSVGTVTIYIVNDMGQCVVKYTCNTLYEPDVFMNVTLGEGSYILRIIGNNYEGEGCF